MFFSRSLGIYFMKSILLILFFSLSGINQLRAQISGLFELKHEVDSILISYNNNDLDTTEINKINKLAVDYRYFQPDSSMFYAKIAYQESSKIDFENGLIQALYSQAGVLLFKGDYLEAISLSLEGLKKAETGDNNFLIGTGFHMQAILYQQLKNDSVAIKNFKKAGVYFKDAGQLSLLLNIYNNLGVVYYNMETYDLAKENYLIALEIAKSLSNKLGQAIIYNNLAWINIKTKIFTKSTDLYLDSAATINEILKIAELNAWIYQGRSEIYLNNHNYDKAEDYGLEALEFAISVNNKMKRRDIRETLSRIYAAKKDGMKAYNEFKIYKELSEKLTNELTEKKALMLQLNYEFEKKELEIRTEQKEKENFLNQELRFQKQIIFVAFISLIIFSLTTIYILKSRKALIDSNQLLRETKNEMQKQHDILDEANNSKNKLFSIISHDLRGPMGSTWIMLEEVKTMIEDKNYDEAFLFLDLATNSSRNSFELLENLLHWARTQLNAANVSLESFDPHEIIDDTFKVLQGNLVSKEIQVGLNIETQKQVLADKEMMRIVFRNLMSNAIKFTPKQGSIHIAVSEKNNQLCISIKDSGIGISAERLKNLFSFTENQSTRGTEGEIGTGLGLVLCKELVQLNKGSLQVFSEVNVGTQIDILLPLA